MIARHDDLMGAWDYVEKAAKGAAKGAFRAITGGGKKKAAPPQQPVVVTMPAPAPAQQKRGLLDTTEGKVGAAVVAYLLLTKD